MDDPIQTYNFIKSIINARKDDIIGIAVSKGNRLTINKNKSKFAYLLSLLLIMGIIHFIKNSWLTLKFKLQKKISKIGFIKNPSILTYAKSLGIPIYDIKSPNNAKFLATLSKLKPDIIINQSQSILKKQLLSIPKIGTVNRHNAILPKNRGRLTPFWVLYKNEGTTGVSIHFVDEGIDSGNIIVQEQYDVSDNDTFNTLVEKNYQIAKIAMLRALKLLENGFNDFIPNDDSLSTYNTTPTLKEAINFRLKRIMK